METIEAIQTVLNKMKIGNAQGPTLRDGGAEFNMTPKATTIIGDFWLCEKHIWCRIELPRRAERECPQS